MITVPPQPKRGRERRFEGDEQERILEAAKKYGGEVSAIIRLAIETAMRRGEIAQLRWENIDIAKKVVTLPDTKNGDKRTVPLSSSALKILIAFPRNISGKVFSMRADSITPAFDRYCKRSGVDSFRFHDLGHEATSRLFELGFNIMEIAAITGHKDLGMLKRYTQFKGRRLSGKAQSMSQPFAKEC